MGKSSSKNPEEKVTEEKSTLLNTWFVIMQLESHPPSFDELGKNLDKEEKTQC